MKTLKLLFVGALMGIADVVPGVSGGSIALIFGVYPDLLETIQNLKFGSLRKIKWPFVLPLFCGIGGAILLFAHLFASLLWNPLYRPYLLGCFFLLMLWSLCCFIKKLELKRMRCWTALLCGAALAFWIASLPVRQTNFSPAYLLLAGFLTACATLLPGISGSLMLWVLGVYPCALEAAGNFASLFRKEAGGSTLQILILIVAGFVLGLVLFSRVVAFMMRSFPQLLFPFLYGLMLGSLPSLWPFS